MEDTATVDEGASSTSQNKGSGPLLTVAGIGGAVAVALGAYASIHDPTGEQPYQLFFTGTINLKVWFATAAIVLAVFQVFSAMRIYGRLTWPAEQPSWLGDAHRLSGTLAFVLSLPVAYHCLWALGLQTDDTRSLVHSVLGCAFYGLFASKVLAVRSHSLPGWTLPVVGSAVFAVLALVWATSAVWFWSTFEFPGF